MYILSGFGDEISTELNEQIDVMKGLGVGYIELRGVWGKNVLDLTEDEIKKIKNILLKNGMKISAIGSPIGKIKITDNFSPHFEKFQYAVELAKFFGTAYVRIFSYYPPENEKIEKYRDEVMERMEKKVQYAEKEKVILCHENESAIYGENPENCLDMLKSINSPNLRAVFDPANFIVHGIKPYTRAYPLLKEWIEYFHIKDALPMEKTAHKIVCVPAGKGEGQVSEILKDFYKTTKNKDVFLSLEPHLSTAGQFGGWTGSDKFSTSVHALNKILSSFSS
ncbi:MAG: sugar phosphate isomerase/epimerase [Candidatus Omnitrophica bacterium]|nr:sugar phosphate isomerase/epimerase [Candidatus Omnitrophota bacterium]